MHNRTLIVASLLALLAVTAVLPASGLAAIAAGPSTSVAQPVQPPGSHWPLILAGIYCVGVVLASLAGGWLPLVIRMTHTRLQLSMSLCGGLMLGIGLLHLLPHAFAVLESLDRAVLWMLTGLLTMFFLIRAFHFHQHEPNPGQATGESTAQEHHAHEHLHGHAHHHPAERLSWIGVAVGLGIHSLIEGMALAASVQVDAAEGGTGLLGIGTFLAIFLHKPFDAVPISILMQARQSSNRLAHLVNVAFAAFCPLGVALFFLGFERFTHHQSAIVGCALAFSAGVFLCISLADLLPELEFHSHDRLKLSLALLVGVAIAYGIGYLEPESAHEHHAGQHEHHD
jgi:zinc and cadmium transporter